MPVVRIRTPSRKKNITARNLARNWAGHEVDLNIDEEIEHQDLDKPLLQGQILKRGSKETDGFLSRWVVVTPGYVSYAKFENLRVIDRIEMDEVVGLASRSDEIEEDEPLLHTDLEAARFVASPGSSAEGGGAAVRRNAVFWRFKLELGAEKKKAFTYKLGHASFALFTSSAGFHRGRTFVFQCENAEQKEKWTETVSRVLNQRLEKPLKSTSYFYNLRKRVRWFYVGDRAQIFVATLIMGNFLLNICQSQVGDQNEDANVIFEAIDLGFTCVFTCELLVNMFATLPFEFLLDLWNWFDFIVVAVSLISLGLTDLPGADVLRLMRCFRVFRLFKRIASLRKIMSALSKSVVPMLNAFSILSLVTAIYSIISVTFFSEIAPELFGSFFIAFFSLFQAMTGDGWSEHCRDLMVSTGQGPMVGSFYVSFMLLVSLVLVNVVIAVLLDAFGKAAQEEPAAFVSEAEEDAQKTSIRCPFQKLAQFLSSCSDLVDFQQRVDEIWLDVVAKGQISKFATGDCHMTVKQYEMLKSIVRGWRFGSMDNWTLTSEEFRRGIKSLHCFVPPLMISRNDYVKHIKAFCNQHGELGRMGFQGLMKTVVRKFQMNQLFKCGMSCDWDNDAVKALMLGTIGLLREDMETQNAGRAANRCRQKQRVIQPEENTIDPVDESLRFLMNEVKVMERRFERIERLFNQNQEDTKPGSNVEADPKEQETKPQAETEKGSAGQRKLSVSSEKSSAGQRKLSVSSEKGSAGQRKLSVSSVNS